MRERIPCMVKRKGTGDLYLASWVEEGGGVHMTVLRAAGRKFGDSGISRDFEGRYELLKTKERKEENGTTIKGDQGVNAQIRLFD